MGSAFAVAVIFLASYLTYHYEVGSMSGRFDRHVRIARSCALG
jgi:hypothetical protein